MILINLLPPELRKSGGGLNPVAMALSIGAAACLALGLLYGWTAMRVKAAERTLAETVAVLEQKTAQAAEVQALKDSIKGFEDHRDTVLRLLARKVYWARTLDDFASHLASRWPGFEVCVTDLSIKSAKTAAPARPAPGAKPPATKDETIVYSFLGKYRIVGEERDRAGDYMRKFLTDTETSQFWTGHQFQGKPEHSYKGDTPAWSDDISRVIVDCPLEFQRAKLVTVAKPRVN